MRIVFDPSTLHRSNKGSVTGVVHFDFGAERQFPVAGWNDFVVVIASWWLAAINAINHSETDTKFRFMDGPFFIAVATAADSKLWLRCIDDRRCGGLVHEVIVDQAEFQREVTNFAQIVCRACAAAHIESADLDELQKLLPN